MEATVSGLNWQDKHIKLQGQSQSGVIITNDPNSGLPAIQLSGMGIDNQDLISNVTFSNCDLTGTGTVRRGAAIELTSGAAPLITNCTFNQNRVGNCSSGTLIAGSATGGAVHVSCNGATSQTNNTPRFVNCTLLITIRLMGMEEVLFRYMGKRSLRDVSLLTTKPLSLTESKILLAEIWEELYLSIPG